MSLARLRAGVNLRYPGQCLTFLADAEYRLGAWDDALNHSELAVSLAQGNDRTWALAFAHARRHLLSSRPTVATGSWQPPTSRLRGPRLPGWGSRSPTRPGPAPKAGPGPGGPARSAGGHVSRAGTRPGRGLRPAGLGRLASAGGRGPDRPGAWWMRPRRRCRKFSPPSPPLACPRPTRRRPACTATWPSPRATRPVPGESFAAAWQLAEGLPLPFQLALLERDDGRRLRLACDRQAAAVRLRQALYHLVTLGAQPACGGLRARASSLRGRDTARARASPVEPDGIGDGRGSAWWPPAGRTGGGKRSCLSASRRWSSTWDMSSTSSASTP